MKKSQNSKGFSEKESAIKNLVYPKLIVLSIVLPLLTVVLVFVLKNRLPPQVPLFYGLPEGEEQLTNTLGLMIPSLVAIAIVLINTIVSIFIKQDFVKKTLVFTALAVVFFSTITTIKIIFLVGNI
jgi:hypothetical protein